MDIRIAAAFFTLCAWHCAFAQQNASAQAQGQQSKPEEILITGERALRIQMMSAEQHAYEVFNQFNDEKRFNISCSINASTGSHFLRQGCQPEFEIDATSAHAQDYLDSMPGRLPGLPPGSVVPTHPPMEMEIARQLPDYKKKIKQVAEQHPEFLDAIKQYAKLKEQYEGVTGKTK